MHANTKSQEEAVLELDLKYGERYDHSKVVYTGREGIIIIICSIHGEFKRHYNHYLNGEGTCPECKKELRSEKRILKYAPLQAPKIQALKDVYGSRFDLNKVVYMGESKNITITCSIHGEFKKTYKKFLQGCYCPDCSRIELKVRTQKNHIEQSKIKFSNKFKYHIDQWGTPYDTIEVECGDHGFFETTSGKHYGSGYGGCVGCLEEALEVQRINSLKPVEKVIEAFNKKHNFYYGYELVEYDGNYVPVKIICPVHGVFEMEPHEHYKYGCNKCNRSKGEVAVSYYLDQNNIQYEEQQSFDDCRGKKNKLPYDFYLPAYNLLIEYQGEFHYPDENRKLIMKQLPERETTDKIKIEYAIEKGYNFLDIPYWEYKIIEEVIEDMLKTITKFT